MDRWKRFWTGVAEGAAWDAIKVILRILYWAAAFLLSRSFVVGGWDFLELVPAVGYAAAFLGYGLMVFGAFALLWLAAGKLSHLSNFLESDEPRLVQAHQWNHIIELDGEKIAVGLIAIENHPMRKTDNSPAFEVSAQLDYYDRTNRKLAEVKCGYWTQDPVQNYFPEMGKGRGCKKINFYTHDTWYLPIAYQVGADEIIYAYDHSKAMLSKKLGKPPIAIKILFTAANLKSTKPLRYLLVPNTTGTYPKGLWIQKR